MKLVEILARELEVWPEGVHMLDQASDGYVCRDRYFFLADDWHSAEVTRPQWQAERDRMNKMEALIEARDNLPSTEPTYEQQLWDRVYLKAFDEIHEMHPTTLSSADVAYSAADIADAFMAERVKRIGK